MTSISLLNLVTILPTGFVSKKLIGEEITLRSILLWSSLLAINPPTKIKKAWANTSRPRKRTIHYKCIVNTMWKYIDASFVTLKYLYFYIYRYPNKLFYAFFAKKTYPVKILQQQIHQHDTVSGPHLERQWRFRSLNKCEQNWSLADRWSIVWASGSRIFHLLGKQ